MQRQALDFRASSIMFVLCIFWGLQQVVLKMAAADISSLMQIALRSGISALLVWPLIRMQAGQSMWQAEYRWAGLLAGALFAFEFFLIAQALRFTSASHTVMLLYTAPIFVALALHYKLPAERLSALQWSGIALAFLGVVVTFMGRSTDQSLNSMLWGDLLALLGSLFWAATTVTVRLTKLSEAPATLTLFYQLLGGFLLLFPLTFVLGQAEIHWTSLAIGSLIFHSFIISFASYLIWFWLLKHYLASRLGVFSFLTPLFGMVFGVLLLNEKIETNFIIGTVLVMLGVFLVSMQTWIQQKWRLLRA